MLIACDSMLRPCNMIRSDRTPEWMKRGTRIGRGELFSKCESTLGSHVSFWKEKGIEEESKQDREKGRRKEEREEEREMKV